MQCAAGQGDKLCAAASATRPRQKQVLSAPQGHRKQLQYSFCVTCILMGPISSSACRQAEYPLVMRVATTDQRQLYLHASRCTQGTPPAICSAA